MTKRFAWAALMCRLVVWTAAFGQETLAPAPEGTFTVVVIPDTQAYRGEGEAMTNPILDAHTRWILENLESQRIVFVSQVGDIVDANEPNQWRVAKQHMDRLHGRVPYGVCVGNHDMAGDGDSSLFQQHFPAARFAEFEWYGGTFAGLEDNPAISGNNANSYQLFSAEGVDFVFLHLECNAPDNVLAWADGILEQYADRVALVTTHMDLGPLEQPKESDGFFKDPKGRMRWVKRHGKRGNSPQQMWDKCFSRHANIAMIFSGDQRRTTAYYLESEGEHGNTVHAMMSDYTSSGPLRLYRFHAADNQVDVITYDTTLNTLVDETAYVPGRENHQFTLEVDLQKDAATVVAAP